VDRAARAFTALHVALILFSTAALTTFLAGAPPDWLTKEPAQTVYSWGWRLSGPLYVIAGAVAILLHAAARFQWGRAFGLLAAGTLISLASELIGTTTGFPFGHYSYTTLLGYRIADLVPFPIPLSWFYMVYSSLAITGRILPPESDQQTKMIWSLFGGAVLTAWDVSMDPAMSRATTHWLWQTSGTFYGMPLTNWVGWFLTGTLVSRAMLAIVPPRDFAARVSPATLPLLIYAANGLMPIAICLRHGLWWAAILGAVAMGLPLAAAARRERALPPVIFER
jgi:putative membrane protein